MFRLVGVWLVTQPLSWLARLRLQGRGEGCTVFWRGVSRPGQARPVAAGLVAAWSGGSWKPPTRSAWSRLRCRKVGWILAVFVMFRQGSLRCRMARFNHSLGQRACDCERRGVEWIMVSSGAVMFRLSGCVLLRHRMNTTIVLARRPINAAVVALSQARWCTVSRCAERRVVFWQNHTRAGTVPDQRRRLGMHHGMVRRVDVGSGKS